jgi:hypothetical protein
MFERTAFVALQSSRCPRAERGVEVSRDWLHVVAASPATIAPIAIDSTRQAVGGLADLI